MAVHNEDVELMIFLLEHGAKIPQKDTSLMAFFSRKLEEYQLIVPYHEDLTPSTSTLSEDLRFLVNNKAYTVIIISLFFSLFKKITFLGCCIYRRR